MAIQNNRLAAVIMAAGQGKRMQDPTKPKVLYPLAGKPILSYVLNLTRSLGSEETIVIIGYARELVEAYISQYFPEAQTVVQAEQLGTGHAVQQTERLLSKFEGDILVLSGDVPLLTRDTTADLLRHHRKSGAQATVLSVRMENPYGYGRIVRTADGSSLQRIVEQKDADSQTQEISEINSGIYVFDANTLYRLLGKLRNNNAQGEYYLTDILSFIVEEFGEGAVNVMIGSDPVEVMGVNTKDQLTELENVYLSRYKVSEENE